MALLVQLGKALLALFFIVSSWEQLVDLGLGKDLTTSLVGPKLDHASSTLGLQLPKIEIKVLIAIGITIKAIGGLLFAYGSSIGTYLLLLYMGISAPLLLFFDDHDYPDTIQSMTLDLAIFGMLLYFVGIDRAMLNQQNRRRFPGVWIMLIVPMFLISIYIT